MQAACAPLARKQRIATSTSGLNKGPPAMKRGSWELRDTMKHAGVRRKRGESVTDQAGAASAGSPSRRPLALRSACSHVISVEFETSLCSKKAWLRSAESVGTRRAVLCREAAIFCPVQLWSVDAACRSSGAENCAQDGPAGCGYPGAAARGPQSRGPVCRTGSCAISTCLPLRAVQTAIFGSCIDYRFRGVGTSCQIPASLQAAWHLLPARFRIMRALPTQREAGAGSCHQVPWEQGMPTS